MDEPAAASGSTWSSRSGDRKPKVTATFFNAKYLKKTLDEGTRVMLSGEVGYFKGTLQLTHPAFLVLRSPTGKVGGTKIAQGDRRGTGDSRRASCSPAFERDFFPIYPASSQGAELGHLRVRAPGARRAGPDRRSTAGIVSAANRI